MFWRLHESLLKDCKDEVTLFLENIGDEVQLVHGPLYTLPPVPQGLSHKPSLVMSTLQDIRLKVNKTVAVPWSYYADGKYNVSYWMPRAVNNGLPVLNSYNCRWCPAGLLPHQLCDAPLFVKSDAGHKIVTGQSVTSYEDAVVMTKDLSPETLLFISPYRDISPIEYRFWIVDRQVVGGAAYSWDENLDVSTIKVPAMARVVAEAAAQAQWIPDLAFVVDVVESDGGYYVNEYNCISTSGLYSGINIPTLFGALRNIAIREFDGDVSFEEC